MGAAVNWQERLEQELADYDIVICNPRRDDWDSSWVQDISHPQFSEQVRWEMEHLENVDLKVFYFDPKGLAPITLLELGLSSATRQAPDNVIVCCPEGYWRRGNVQMVCDRYNITLTDTIDQFISTIKEVIEHRLLFLRANDG